MNQSSPIPLIVGLVIAFVVLVILYFILSYVGIWFRAWLSKAPVPIASMVAMRFRRVPVGLIVDQRITAMKAGIDISSEVGS